MNAPLSKSLEIVGLVRELMPGRGEGIFNISVRILTLLKPGRGWVREWGSGAIEILIKLIELFRSTKSCRTILVKNKKIGQYAIF